MPVTGFYVFVTDPDLRATEDHLRRLLARLQAEGVVDPCATLAPGESGFIRWRHGPRAYDILYGQPDGDNQEFVLHLADARGHLYEMWDASCSGNELLGRSPLVLDLGDFRSPLPDAPVEMMSAALGASVAYLPSYWG